MLRRLIALLGLILPIAACESNEAVELGAPDSAVAAERPADIEVTPASPEPTRAAGYVVAGGPVAEVAAEAAMGILGEGLAAWIERRHHSAMALASARAAEAPAGRRIFWEKRETNGSVSASGWAMASGNASSVDGKVCRPLRQAATQDGETRRADLIVCRLPDGSWIKAS